MESVPPKEKWYQAILRYLKSLFKFLFGKSNSNTGIDMNYLFKRGIISLVILTILISLLFLGYCSKGIQNAILNFLMLASACFAGGAALGFLFGLPRSEKYRYIKADNGSTDPNRDFAYADNTNLEEVSDWLTKIIVGLSLVKFQTILFWIDKAAHNFQAVVNLSSDDFPVNAYVLGYCTIILYFITGGGMVYLWSRVNLHVIFTDSRLALAMREKSLAERERNLAERDKELAETANKKLEEEKRQLVNQSIGLANEKLISEQELAPVKAGTGEEKSDVTSTDISEFKKFIQEIYATKGAPIDREDLQKGRWGGNPNVGGFVFDAYPESSKSFYGISTVVLRVKNYDPARKWSGMVAFFLHDTFPSQVVYSNAKDGVAEYRIVAYEAFVVGARTDTGVELELDLNKVPGFPPGFYYT